MAKTSLGENVSRQNINEIRECSPKARLLIRTTVDLRQR